MNCFLQNYSLLVVLAVVLAIWAGVFFFLIKIDSRLKKLENKINSKDE